MLIVALSFVSGKVLTLASGTIRSEGPCSQLAQGGRSLKLFHILWLINQSGKQTLKYHCGISDLALFFINIVFVVKQIYRKAQNYKGAAP